MKGIKVLFPLKARIKEQKGWKNIFYKKFQPERENDFDNKIRYLL